MGFKPKAPEQDTNPGLLTPSLDTVSGDYLLTSPVASLKYKHIEGRDHVCNLFCSVPGSL